MQGVRNMLAHERLFLPTVDTTIDFLRIAHGDARIGLEKWKAQRKSRFPSEVRKRIG